MTESRLETFLSIVLYEYLQLLPLLPFEQTSVGESWNTLVTASRNW